MLPEKHEVGSRLRAGTLLLGICTQIRDEAAPIFYKETIFWRDSPNALQYDITRAMERDQYINIQHVSLIPFSCYLAGGTFTTWRLFTVKHVVDLLDSLAELPQLRTLEVPPQMTDEPVDFDRSWLEIMTTLYSNGGHLRVGSGWTNSQFDEWRHYISNGNPTFLALTSIKIETWNELVETDFKDLFERIMNTALVEHESRVVPQKNITVYVDDVRYVVQVWGLPDKVAKSQTIQEDRRRFKAWAETASLARAQYRLPQLMADGESDGDDDLSDSRKNKVTREGARERILRKDAGKRAGKKADDICMD